MSAGGVLADIPGLSFCIPIAVGPGQTERSIAVTGTWSRGDYSGLRRGRRRNRGIGSGRRLVGRGRRSGRRICSAGPGSRSLSAGRLSPGIRRSRGCGVLRDSGLTGAADLAGPPVSSSSEFLAAVGSLDLLGGCETGVLVGSTVVGRSMPRCGGDAVGVLLQGSA